MIETDTLRDLRNKFNTLKKTAEDLDLFVFEEAHHHARKGEKVHEHIEVVVFKSHEHACHGRTDVRTHDDGGCLHQGHNPRVYKTDHHDRGGRRALDDRCYARTDTNAREAVVADLFEQAFHSASRAFFKRIAHKIHADDKDADAREQPNQALQKLQDFISG